MGWLQPFAWAAVVVGVVGYVVNLRGSRRHDDVERGLLTWVVVAWAGVLVLVAERLS